MNKFEVIEKFFPEVITEKNFNGELKKAVDFELLKNILTDEISDERESYNFNWVGKNNARIEAYRKIDKTLRPCIDESENFFTTENLYIEGDNLDVLKLLQQSYLHKVKMIYIDPPYNTGKDFIYKDNFEMDAKKYAEAVELYDDEGNLNFAENTMTNPRFHSDWCSMIYSRLILARNLLTDDGVIFISIDDNEQANLKKICDEVFGERNFIANLVWEKKRKGAFLSKTITNIKEYIFVYCKSMDKFRGLVGEINREIETYPCINPTNSRSVRIIRKGTFSKFREKNYKIEANTRISAGNMDLIYLDTAIIENGTLQNDIRIESNWRYQQKLLDEYASQNLLYLTQDNYIRRIVKDTRIKMLKDLLLRVGNDNKAETFFTYDENLNNGGWSTNEDANEELHEIFNTQYTFDFAKPSRLIGKLIQSTFDKDSIVLDFFSGSATTAHAVMQLNSEDKGARKFIMVQLPEVCSEKTEAFKAGYKNICEIGKERIRRAGKKISVGDIGFRVLKVDSSNFRKVAFKPSEMTQEMLLDLAENIKSDRTELDLLFGSLTDLGVELNLKLTEENFNGAKIYRYDENILACFNEKIELEIFEHMAQEKPRIAIYRDSCFIDDAEKINAEEIFKMISPDTKFKVL